MTAIWYTGTAVRRIISVADWATVGITVAGDTVWSRANGWSIPRADFTEAQITVMAMNSGLWTTAPDGPRVWADIPGGGTNPGQPNPGDEPVMQMIKMLAEARSLLGTAAVPLNSIMALGDSLSEVVSPYDPATGYDSHNGLPSGGHSACDWLYQGNLLADSVMNVLGSAATAGYSAEQIRDIHLPTILAAKPTYCVVQAGANNALADGEFPNSVFTVVEGICASLVAAGITPILATFPPATLQSLSQNEIDRMNAWASEYAHRNGYPLLDFYNALVDHSTGGYKAGYTTDDLHPSSLGSTAQALVVRDVIKKISTTGSRASLAGFNASGVAGLAANPLLAPADGEPNRPDGWYIMGSPTLSLTASPIAGNELTVSKVSENVGMFANDIECVEGDIWDFCCRITATPGATGTYSVGILDQTGGNFVANAYDHRLPIPGGAVLHWRGRTPAGVTKLRAYFGLGTGSGAQVKISQVTLRNLTAKGINV